MPPGDFRTGVSRGQHRRRDKAARDPEDWDRGESDAEDEGRTRVLNAYSVTLLVQRWMKFVPDILLANYEIPLPAQGCYWVKWIRIRNLSRRFATDRQE